MEQIVDNKADIRGKTLKLVSINIVNWNGLNYLRNCIESIKSQTYENIEINIIDNNSSDDSVRFLSDNYPEIRLIANAGNEGFSKAHNQAIRISSGELILPLNFDIVLAPNFVQEMVKAIESATGIGIVSGKLYVLKDEKRTNIIDSTGITMLGMFASDRDNNETDSGDHNEADYIFGASGAAPLLSRNMLEDIKLFDEYFDEDFYIYFEDVDLCWRAQLYGWKALYTPTAIAYHNRGATRHNNSTMKKEYILIGYRNRSLAIIKNAIFLSSLKNIIWILIIETGFYFTKVIEGNLFVLKVPFMTLRYVPLMLRKRTQIQKRKKVSAEYMERFFFSNIRRAVVEKILGRFSGRGGK